MYKSIKQKKYLINYSIYDYYYYKKSILFNINQKNK